MIGAHVAQAGGRACGDRLLAEFEIETFEFAQMTNGFFRRPSFVRIHADDAAIDRAHRLEHRDLVARAHFDFENRHVERFARLADHFFHVVDADRERRLQRLGRIQAEEAVDGNAEPLTRPIVQREVQGAHRAALIRRYSAQHVVEMPEVCVGQIELAQLAFDEFGILVVAFYRRRFANTIDAVCTHVQNERPRDVFR
jgi:hypothetical protein